MAELLCIVGEDDILIGPGERERVHCSDMWHRGVHILLSRPDGRMLLQMRGKDRDKYPSHYDLSVSEHVNFEESYEEAAVRGLKEELGIEAPLVEIAHFRMNYGPADNMVARLYTAVYGGEIEAASSETASLHYLTEAEISRMLEADPDAFAPWTREILKHCLGMDNNLIMY